MKKVSVCLLAVFILLNCCQEAQAVSTSARSAVLITGDSGEVIYSQNENERLPMASTTKIMTALLLCEYGHFDEEITVTKEMVAVEGSSMGLLPGDKVTLHDLLYGIMLASGNDAANVAATVIGGTVLEFVEIMNKKAAELGLENTHFVTPSGLDAAEHYTTALDLANLARFALKNDEFAKAAASKTEVLNYGNPPYRRSLSNHNRLLKSYEGAVGVKTGFTKKSGRCLVSAAKRDGKFLIAVTLNDGNDWKDHTALLDYGFSVLKQIEYMPQKSSYSIPVISGLKENIEIKIAPYTINALNTEGITCEVLLPEFVYAPIKAGDTVGEIEYLQNGEILQRVKLTSSESVKIKKTEKNGFKIWLKNLLIIFRNI
ncbi:MAG: D-alanyl-D-alanine carboxypeptidase [Clostridia bacterium]|nr:D-alanyl-D-alanine carboxypeptidase [Clostridia bacterium]